MTEISSLALLFGRAPRALDGDTLARSARRRQQRRARSAGRAIDGPGTQPGG